MNRRLRGYRYILAIAIIALMGALFINNHKAVASEIVLPEEYYFVFNGMHRKDGSELELKKVNTILQVTSGTWESGDTEVEWISSEPRVVDLEDVNDGSNFVKLVRKGPGFSTITAIIKQGGYRYSISCQVKVDLDFDHRKTGTIQATTVENRILVLDKSHEKDNKKQIFLKYVDYVEEEGDGVITGLSIPYSAVTWESDNEGVVTVDEKGLVTAVGAGSAKIIVTTNTMSSKDFPIQKELLVVVKPSFSLEYDDSSGDEITVESSSKKENPAIAENAPSNFVIESNASFAENLKWVVYDSSNSRRLPANGDKLNYSVSTISGNVSFSNVKAGTYEIYAFAREGFNENTNAPYAYMKIIVPIVIEDLDIVMNVGDSYDLFGNSNIPHVGIFNYNSENPNIARIDQKTGIITARSKGQVKLTLTYQPSQNLYDSQIEIEDIIVNITVIDGIALSLTNASMYTSGTLMLDALVTDPTQTVYWESSNPQIASVEDGLVTAHRPGIVTIRAYQIVDGIKKSASSEISIQQSVSRISIDPPTLTLPIGGYKTLHASISPNNLVGVNLEWKSSNDSIVEIVEAIGFTATIQAKRAGNVVISAINQDNVVVGYSHITVEQPVTSISLSETDVTLNLPQRSLQLRASVYPENATNKNIKWTSTDTSKARVDDNGLVTLVSPGSVSIIASSVDNPSETAICNINIEIPVASVSLDERTKTMYVGQSSRLTYIVLPVNASKNGVTWESTDTSVVTVDNSGRVTARGVGTAVVILRTLEGGHSVYATINVRQVPSGVSFNVSQIDLNSGETYRLRPSFTPANSTDTYLTWESSDTGVATVSDDGVIEARDAGTAIIFAKTETGATAHLTVNVTQPVEGLILNFSEKTIYVGQTFEMRASVNPSDASDLAVSWKSSNTDVATIDNNGIVTGIKGGTTIITAITEDGGFKESCVVFVRELISEISLNHSQYILGVGKTINLTATVTNEAATHQDVRWVSSNSSIASVNQRGKVTGLKIGNVTITAIAKDGSQVEAYSEIEVVRPITRITLDRNFMTMYVGDTRKLNAKVTPSNATYRNPIYTSSDEDIAMVTEDGNVIGVSPGTVTITAKAADNSNKSAICVVTVNNRVPATSITVMERRVTMVPGETKYVQVALNPANSTDSITWSSDNNAVARVDRKTGKITARNTGTALITVMTESARIATIEVTVIGLNRTNITLQQYSRYESLTVEGATGPVNWTIDNPQVAVLRRQGNSVVVESRAVGKATITARVNGQSLRCNLTVTKV